MFEVLEENPEWFMSILPIYLKKFTQKYPNKLIVKILVTGTLVFGLLPNLLLHFHAYMTVYHDYCIVESAGLFIWSHFAPNLGFGSGYAPDGLPVHFSEEK